MPKLGMNAPRTKRKGRCRLSHEDVLVVTDKHEGFKDAARDLRAREPVIRLPGDVSPPVVDGGETRGPGMQNADHSRARPSRDHVNKPTH
jgi:hypothetical protein